LINLNLNREPTELAAIDFNKLRIQKRKKDPPVFSDYASQEEIDMYNEFGGIGWKYFTDELIRGNEILDNYIDI